MRTANFEQELTSFIRRAKMKFEPRAKEDLLTALNNFTDLKPDCVNFVFPDGITKYCLSVSGTIPINYKGGRYNIPVAMYFLDNHPYSGPYCYVRPTPTMRIRSSKVVDDTGRIYLPYLTEWQYPRNDTVSLLQVMEQGTGPKNVLVYSASNSNSAAATPPYPPNRGGTTNPPYPTVDPAPHLMPQPSNPGYTPMPQPNSRAGYQPPYPTPYPLADHTQTSTPPQPEVPYNYGTGTIQSSHIRASLLSAVEDRIRQKLRDKIGTPFAELQSIDVNLKELQNGKQTLRNMLEGISRDQQELDRALSLYSEKREELERALQSANMNGTTANGTPLNVEDAIGAQTAVHRQILNCYVQDCAIDDTIYHLGQALKRGSINLQTYLKYVRQLSHQQFLHRMLMYKCRERAQLPV